MFLKAVWLLACLQIHLVRRCDGLTLSPCGTDNTLEVVENKGDNLFTCSGLNAGDTVQWGVMVSNAGSTTDAGRCSSFPTYTCTVEISPVFTPGREVATTATMTVDATDTRYNVFFQGTSIQCRALQNNSERESITCKLDHIAKPTSGVCNILVNTSTVSSRWTLTVNCTVTGVYSYLDRYTCQLFQTVPSAATLSSTVNMTVVPSTNTKYKTGMCDVTVPFPDTSTTYSYKIVVTPGRVDVVASFEGSNSFQIRRPGSPPSHNCPQYVAETQGVNCRCSATDLGQPAGVVRWRGFPSNQLSLSNVNKNQHGTQFVCEVMWNGGRVQSVAYILQVAYGPSSVSIITPSLPVDTNGSQQVTLTCSASEVNPPATFTWPTLPGNNVVVQGQMVKFKPQPPGDDNSVFECEAENNITGITDSSRVTVSLNYPPSTDPVISTTSLPTNSGGHLNQGDRVTLACTVTGGMPLSATVVNFTCPQKPDSPDSVGSTGISSSVTFDNLTDSDHNTECTCSTRWKDTDWYNRMNTTRLFVNYEATIRFFAVNSVTSDSLTVNTSDTVTLTCRGVGRPLPEMTLSSTTQDAIKHIPQGTPSLQDKVTEVTGSVTAQCRDTGNYTCEASNGVGEKQTRRVTVFVRCKPEVLDNRPGDGGRMDIPSVNFVTKAVRLNFHFAAYPTPWLSDIKFFPQRPNMTSVGKPVKGNTIQVACSRHPVDLFNVTCAVTVSDVTSSDAGFYQAVIGNSLGDVTVLFQVKVNGGKQDSSLGVGAAVGVSVAVMVVIVVVFFFWLWRRQWVLPCAGTEREADVRMESRNVEPAQGIEQHGQGQSDDYEIQNIGGTTSAEYASLKIDDIGLRSVYSKITPTSTSTRTTVTADTGQVYENTDMSSRSPYVNASDYKR